jgi:chemotaxis protein CheD
MREIVVGIGECRLARGREYSLATYALGSCIAVAAYDREAGAGGLLHFMLPAASDSSERADRRPFLFAEPGIPKLIELLERRGACRERMEVFLAGGARALPLEDRLQIGRRNYHAARLSLRKAGVSVRGAAVGGNVARSVRLEVGTGTIWLRTTPISGSAPNEEEKWQVA